MTTATLSLQNIFKTVRSLVSGRNFFKNVGILTIANVFAAALSLIQGIFVARWLGPELYGVVALVTVYPGLVYTFVDARSGDAMVKYLSEFHARKQEEQALAVSQLGYLVDFAVAGLAFLIVLLSAPWAAAKIAHHPAAAGLMVAYAAAFIPRAGFATSQAVLTIQGKFSLIASLTAAITALRVAVILGLVLAGWQVAGVIVGQIFAMLLEGLIFGAIAWVSIKRLWGASVLKGDRLALKGRRREIFSFLVYTDLNALLTMIPKQLDIVLLGYFRNLTEVGYYKLGKTLAGMVGLLVKPLQSVTYPEFARLWGLKNREAIRKKVRLLMFQVGLPSGAAVLAATVLLPYLVPLFFGEAFLPAVLASQILLAGGAIWLVFFWLRPVFMTYGAVRMWFLISTLTSVLSLIAYPFIIPWGGVVILAAWYPIITLLTHGIAFMLYRRNLSLRTVV